MNKYIIGAALLLSLASCKDEYLETLPQSSTSPETLFADTEKAKIAVNGIARLMVAQYNSTQGMNGEGTMKTYYGEWAGNDFSSSGRTNFSNVGNCTRFEVYDYAYVQYPWAYYYKLISNANVIIERIDAAEGTQAERDFIKAQALTYRAYSYFMLSQLYCKRWVDSNNGASRGLPWREDTSIGDCAPCTLGELYGHIYTDLDNAIEMFSNAKEAGVDRAGGQKEHWQPNLDVARCVYARAALTRQDWSKAAQMAKDARVGYKLMTGDQYKSGFNTPNSEWIWGHYSSTDQNIYYFSFFAYNSPNGTSTQNKTYPPGVSKQLIDQIPLSDVRRELVVVPNDETEKYGSSEAYDAKGKATTKSAGKKFAARVREQYGEKISSATAIYAYMCVKFQLLVQPGIGEFQTFRASEMLLTEAEALAELGGHETEVQALLNELNKSTGRDPEYNCTATGTNLRDEVRLYRRWDLWGEGFNWYDYKRWNLPIDRKAFGKGGSFNSTMAKARTVDSSNRWTMVYPRDEMLYNHAITAARED